MKTPDKKYFENPEKYIPHGMYCYIPISIDSKTGIMKIDICPFWDKDFDREDQIDGYCHYLKLGDWMEHGTSLLWDQCKECDINDIKDEDITLDNN